MEESFLGDNAGLVNLDSLIAPLPPPAGMVTNNPFGMPAHASPKLSNPFEANKPAAPSLAQLKQNQTPMFGKWCRREERERVRNREGEGGKGEGRR